MTAATALPIPFGWYGVAYSADLQPGEVKPLRYFGQEMVLFRSEDGGAAVLDAYCPHLGAHLGHGGHVNGDRVVCPFHAWEFSGDGFCRNVPYAQQMPPKVRDNQALYAYPVVERNGVIWVWYHPQREAPLFEVVELPEATDPEWTDFRCFEWELNSHIQETGENAADAAHFLYVHRNADVPKGEVRHEGHRREANYQSQAPAIDEDGNFDRTGTQWRDTFLHTCNNGPGQSWQRFTGVSNIVMQGIVTPISESRLHLRFAFTQPKNLNAGQKILADAIVEEISRQVEQDIPIWEHKIYRPEPILCDGDGPINQYRKWFRQFYA